MAGRVAGKVAFVTGAARGQGRSHAIRLAEEGADIIAVDILQDYETVSYGMGTEQDLADTVTAVAARGRKIVARKADVRDAAAVPHLIGNGGGSIICISSTAGIKGLPFFTPYVAAKHGVVGLAKSMANELARHNIRVNTVHPTGVNTPMGTGLGALHQLLAKDPNLGPIYMNALAVDPIEPRDVSNAVLFLASYEARYVTGLEFTVDAGCTIR